MKEFSRKRHKFPKLKFRIYISVQQVLSHQLDMHLKICHYSLEEGAILHKILSFLRLCNIFTYTEECKH